MECILSIVPCLLERSADSAAKQAAYVRDLEDNHRSLVTEIGKLKCRRDDLSNRVKEAEENSMKRTNEVNDWLERVKAVEENVNEILPKVTQELEKRCLGSCCPKNCKSSYKLGKEVAEMIPQVKSLMEEGKFDVVAHELAPPPVVEQRMDDAVVGFESKLEELWRHVQSKDIPIIGLVGMGGVGKTTLLMQLNNKFLEATDVYDVVIWIVVSRPVNVGNIQASFKSRLNLPDRLWDKKNEGERATLISEKLGEKKFVVLLDDMWDRLDLSKVGIPQPSKENMSKVVFTTRSQQVCNSMKAQKIDVSCLPPKPAFDLFRSIVGEEMLKCHPELIGLAVDVARECKGLPLALTVIGRSMIGSTDAQDWKDAKTMLEKYPSDMEEVKGEVFPKLLFSYDRLPTLTLKKCFEYCSLYPEDNDIAKDDVIMLWIAERLIDADVSMYDALVRGRRIMKSLVQAGLLEADDSEGTVRMHDMIRDMSLWLACDRGERRNKIWVDVLTDVTRNSMAECRTNIEKASLWGPGTKVESLAWLSFCSNLVTLIVRDTELEELPGEIFHSMKVLKVLDLSRNRQLGSLPREICGLTSLEYLNLMTTSIHMLPVEIEQLKKLRFFMVAMNTVIPKTVISGLRLLVTLEQEKVLFMSIFKRRLMMGYEAFLEGFCKSLEKGMLEELEGLEHIRHLRLVLKSAAGIQKLLETPKLQSCIGQLSLATDDSLPAELDLRLIKNLEKLEVAYCGMCAIKFGRSTFYSNIRKVSFFSCHKIQNLNSLVYVPSLCILKLRSCKSMEELIGEETGSSRYTNEGISLFSCLTRLHLSDLPKLRSSCPQSALPFPCLKLMTVFDCMSLRKLPLNSNTANTTPPELKIEGKKEWWGGLKWDSQATKDAFTPKFVPRREELPMWQRQRKLKKLRNQTNRLETHNASVIEMLT